MKEQSKTYLTVNQLAERQQLYSSSGIRHLIWESEKNGFKKCMRRIGKKIFICEEDFYSWIESNKCE